MPDASDSFDIRCPMCGAALATATGLCPECGEPLGAQSHLPMDRPLSETELRYEKNLAILEVLLIWLGHISWIVAIAVMVTQSLEYGVFIFLVAGAWIASGYACGDKQRWGILTGLIVSYLTLGASLMYWNLFGIAVSLSLSIQAHRVLRFSHQVLALDLDSDEVS